MGEKTKATQRNMRSKKDGSVLNANHVTLEATRKGQRHIDQFRFEDNAYWRFESDGKVTLIQGGSGGFNATKHELKRYKELFGEGQEAKNERYIKNRNKSNCRTIEELYRNPKTAPLEQLWQIGNSKTENMTTYEMRLAVFKAWSETVKEMRKRWGDNLKFLDAGLHMEEQVPHIHSRLVLGAEDKYGHFMPNQSQAFKEMQIERPDPEKPRSRYNNELIAFSDTVREMFYQNCDKQGLVIDREVRSASHRQKELLEYQVEQLLKEVEKHREVSRETQEALERTLGNIDSLNGQIKSLEAVKALLEKEKAVLEADKKNLENKVDSLVAERDDLKQERVQLKTENKQLKTENKQLQGEKSDLEREVIQTQSELRNLRTDKEQEIIKRNQAVADRKAAVAALKAIEEHQEHLYESYQSRKVRTYEQIPAQKEKKNFRGQVVQEARPECVVVAKEDLERQAEQAQYNVNVRYSKGKIEELEKQLATNEIFAEQQKKIADQQLEINRLNMEGNGLMRKVRQLESQVMDRDNFIQEQGLTFEFNSQHLTQEHHHHRRR